MKPKLTLIGSLILLSCFGLPANAAMRSAKVSGGQLEGISKGAVSAFLGIPFAAPPTGDLRWRPPRPAAPWSGVLDADHFSRSCYQRDQTGGFGPWTTEFVIPGPVSEDCLYLNVWTPAESDQARLPVLFWIYGGGFDSGSGSVPLYRRGQRQLSGQRVRFSRPPRAHRRISPSRVGKLRPSGPAGGTAMGPGEHCSAWRGPESGHDRGSICRGRLGPVPDVLASR